MEDKKSLFEPFHKVSLATGNEKKKSFFKLLSVVKKVCQAFDFFVNKVVKFTEAFQHVITSVPLADTKSDILNSEF